VCWSGSAALSTPHAPAGPTRRPGTSRCWTRCPTCRSTHRARSLRQTRSSWVAVAEEGLHYVRVVEQTNRESFAGRGLHVVRRGSGATVIALGPVLDEVLAATADRDVSVLYAHTVRPFDSAALRRLLTTPEVVLVEPWLAGTSARCIAEALVDVPHRLLALGTRRHELRHYGSPADHQRAHGLDAAGLRRSVDGFLDGASDAA
jgi:transketolase